MSASLLYIRMPTVNKSNYTDFTLSAAASVISVGATAVILNSAGRVWWCKQGDTAIFVNAAWKSSHTSQHILDPYTLTHVLHGVGLMWILGYFLPRVAIEWRLVAAVILECGWEILENSDFIIERYRANTASFDYFGDSIANSISDIAACAAGFLIATRLGNRWSLLLFIVVELFLILWVRDSLLINILMLLYPLQSVKQWQLGG